MSAEVFPDLAERLAFVAGSLNRRLRPPADTLSHIALSALASIQRAGATRPGDLARAEGIAAPGMTRLLADLEQRGLVERSADPGDGRSQLIRLTESGLTAIDGARSARAAGVAAILADVPEEDLETLKRAVRVLEHALLITPVPSSFRTDSDSPGVPGRIPRRVGNPS